MKKYIYSILSGVSCLTVFTILLILMVVSCDYFEKSTEYSITSFDEGVASGLLDNVYSVALDSVTLAKFFVTSADGKIDAKVDSLIKIPAEREAIFNMLDTSGNTLTPSMRKYVCFIDPNYVHAYGLLDLGSTISSEDHLVFYLDNYLDLQIWDANGNSVDLFSNSIDWGIVSVSQQTKARFEYSLAPGQYLVRFTRSEIMIKEEVNYYHLVLLPESSQPSLEAELVCSILNSVSSDDQEVALSALAELDTNWVSSKIADIYPSDSLRQELVSDLEAATSVIRYSAVGQRIDGIKNTEVETGFMLIDFTEGPASAVYKLYLNDYYDASIWGAVDSLAVPMTEIGVTYNETGACSNLRKINSVNLENKKYILGLSKISGTGNRSRFQILVTEE